MFGQNCVKICGMSTFKNVKICVVTLYVHYVFKPSCAWSPKRDVSRNLLGPIVHCFSAGSHLHVTLITLISLLSEEILSTAWESHVNPLLKDNDVVSTHLFKGLTLKNSWHMMLMGREATDSKWGTVSDRQKIIKWGFWSLEVSSGPLTISLHAVLNFVSCLPLGYTPKKTL